MAIHWKILDCFVALAMTILVLVGLAPVEAGSRPAAATEQKQDVAPLGLALTGRVVDAANVIDESSERVLTSNLAGLEHATTDQLVVVTIPSLRGRPIEQVALELGRNWKIGQSELNNGVLLVVAPNERKARIEVGLGLEGLLTDARAGEIIREMIPHFRARNIPKAVRVGSDRIRTVLLTDRRRPQYRSEARRRYAA